MTYSEFLSSEHARQRYWARSHIGWARMDEAHPNEGHHALRNMETSGWLSGLITQNVDGLHERAGQLRLITLHGRIADVVCLACGRLSSREALQLRLDRLNPGFAEQEVTIAPDGDAVLEHTSEFVVAACEVCGGTLKPEVVFFGESVPKQRVAQSAAMVAEAEGLLVAGSSLQVMSGLRFVRQAAKAEIPVVIINRGATRGDDLADVKVDAGVAETLQALQS